MAKRNGKVNSVTSAKNYLRESRGNGSPTDYLLAK